MNEDTFRREKLVYSASANTESDLVGDIWSRVKDFLEVAHWASNRQIQVWLRGFATDRYTTLEKLLQRKAKRGQLRVARYGKPKVYAKPGKTRGVDTTDTLKLYHGLSCTECYLRFIKSEGGEAMPERFFRGYGAVPEFGIKYENGILLAEFSTKHDTEYHERLKGKLSAYERHLPKIEEDLKAKAVVVFILDVAREKVSKLIEKYTPTGPYYFVDYQTFLQVPLGEALTSPIYFWTDGLEYPLKKNA